MKTIYNPSYRKLIDWLAYQRQFMNVSRATVSKNMGLKNISFVEKVERYETKLDVLHFVLLCNALQVDPKGAIEVLNVDINPFE